MVALSSARERGRDAKRMRDIEEIRNAIELYIYDYGHAPDFGNAACSDPEAFDTGCFANDMGSSPFSWADLESDLSDHISELPVDPCGISCFNKQIANNRSKGFFTYRYNAPGTSFGVGGLGSGAYAIFAQNLESKAQSFGFGAGSF